MINFISGAQNRYALLTLFKILFSPDPFAKINLKQFHLLVSLIILFEIFSLSQTFSLPFQLSVYTERVVVSKNLKRLICDQPVVFEDLLENLLVDKDLGLAVIPDVHVFGVFTSPLPRLLPQGCKDRCQGTRAAA